MYYEDLHDFILGRMRMTHIYQPVMLKALIESKTNSMTAKDIASRFLNEDLSQLNYYEAIVKKWPHATLVRKHKIVKYCKGTYSLQLGNVSDAQKQMLIKACDLRLKEFIDGDPAIMKLRELDRRSKSGSNRYDILAKSKGVCVACGAKPPDVFLHVDHIIPIARGGRDEADNMQALCHRCNIQKKDRDDTDFLLWRKQLQFAKNPKCRLCSRPHDTIMNNTVAYAFRSGTGTVVAPVRHVGSFAEMIPVEKQLCMALVDRIIDDLRNKARKDTLQVSGLDSSGTRHCRICITAK